MNTAVYSTGDKILNVMKEMDMSIPGLAELSGIHENTLLNILLTSRCSSMPKDPMRVPALPLKHGMKK